MPDLALLSYLTAIAVQLSGYPAPDPSAMPRIESVPAAQIGARACPQQPESCQGIVAFYDPAAERIVVRADLDLDQPSGQSFLVHELVHVLQHRHHPRAMAVTACERMLRSEREAYRVQNQFLVQQGVLERHGEQLSRVTCPREQPPGADEAGLYQLERTGLRP